MNVFELESSTDTNKRAYQIGQIMVKLHLVKKYLHMGDAKSALGDINEVIKFIETEIVSEFYPAKIETKIETKNEIKSNELQDGHPHEEHKIENTQNINRIDLACAGT
jgi:hypothetical protein